MAASPPLRTVRLVSPTDLPSSVGVSPQLGAIGLLDSVQGMALIELNLDGNQLCDSFKEKADYIRYRVRRPGPLRTGGSPTGVG